MRNEIDNYQFEIVEMEGRRIQQVQVTRLETQQN